jgi:hypothetical protein
MYSYSPVNVHCSIRNKDYQALLRGRLPKKFAYDFFSIYIPFKGSQSHSHMSSKVTAVSTTPLCRVQPSQISLCVELFAKIFEKSRLHSGVNDTAVTCTAESSTPLWHAQRCHFLPLWLAQRCHWHRCDFGPHMWVATNLVDYRREFEAVSGTQRKFKKTEVENYVSGCLLIAVYCIYYNCLQGKNWRAYKLYFKFWDTVGSTNFTKTLVMKF